MSSYEKFDPSVIKKRIKDGEYDSLTGANRAIGKTQNLSDEDRDSLKKFAAKHFGVEAAPAKKVAKKKAAKAPKAAVAKKASKRAAKKVGKKAAKKAATKSAADSEAATQVVAAEKPVSTAVRVSGKGRVAKATAAAKQLTLPFGAKPQEVVQMMGAVIGSVSQMLESMKLAQVLYPKATLAESVPTAVRTMTRAVSVLEQNVVSPLDHDKVSFTAAKEPVAKVKAKPAAKAVAKRERALGTRPVAAETPEEEEAPENEQSQGEDLSEEDQEEFDQLASLAAAGDDEG